MAGEMSLDLERLENVKRLDGGAIRAACPACRMSGSDKTGDHLLLQSNGKFGCATNPNNHGHRQEIFRLAGRRDSNGFAHKDNAAGKSICAYDYQDVGGKLVFQVCRFSNKDFQQRRPDPTKRSEWIWNISGVERVLFRLPEIIRAVNGGKRIFLCEGEKDCEAMATRGFDATCNSGGAVEKADSKKWLDSYTETLRGADVTIVADKDEAGRKHAKIVAGKLRGVAKSVRVIELPDINGQPVKDAADFFAAGGKPETILELVETAPEWTPQAAPLETGSSTTPDQLPGNDAPPEPTTLQPQPSLLERLAKRAYSPTVKPIEQPPRFFLNGVPICFSQNLTTFSAQAKAGKTAALNAVIASTFAAPDADCLGFTSQNPNGHAVVHIDTEQCWFRHWNGVSRLIRRAKVEAAPDWLRSFYLKGFSVAEIRQSIHLLTKQAKEQYGGIHSIIIDGIADIVHNVNDIPECNGIISELEIITVEFDCPIINIIHLNPGSFDKTRGHLGSYLERKSETNLKLEKNANGVSTMWAEKNRDAPIPKTTAPRFIWSNDHQMHVSIQNLNGAKVDAEREMLTNLTKVIFANQPTLRRVNLESAIKSKMQNSDSTAERTVKKMLKLGIIKKNPAKLYVFDA